VNTRLSEPLRYTTLSFDLDGTLVNTAGEIAEAANRTLEDFGVPRQPVALISRFIGAGTRHLMLQLREQVIAAASLQPAQLPVEPMLERLEVHYTDTTGLLAQPYPGCAETLAALRAAGVRLACLTNKEHRFALRVLAATGLQDAFDLIVGGDTLPQRKPDPRTLQHVLSALGGAPAQAAHIGDSRIDVETAKAAGVAAWAVPWGYNAGEPIIQAKPDVLFESLPQIARHVLGEALRLA
jgi:phosphoglycolate phosphatase